MRDGHGDRPIPGKTSIKWLLAALLILAFALTLGVFFWEAIHYFDTPSIWGNAQDVKDKLDAYEKHAGVLQALLSALLLVTTFYSAGLGVFSYLNARNILEDARRSAVEAKEAYPLVADMEEQIEQLIKRFDLMFPDVDWSQGFNADPQVKT